jgi:hypothetical protein
MRVRDLTPRIDGPVRILCIVIESREGVALVQDIIDDDVEVARTIEVTVEGTLEVAQKYLLIGEVSEKRNGEGTSTRLVVSLADNINALDIKGFKRTLELEERVLQALVK